MGVITKITPKEVNKLFPSYNCVKLIPTSSGIIDTTYIMQTKTSSYILKKYERDIKEKIKQDIKLLKTLKDSGLNVPVCIDNVDDWYVYEKLQGKQVNVVKTFHIQELARFLAKQTIIILLKLSIIYYFVIYNLQKYYNKYK